MFLIPFCCGTGQKALADAGIKYSAVQQACVGYVYGMLYLLSIFNIVYDMSTGFYAPGLACSLMSVLN